MCSRIQHHLRSLFHRYSGLLPHYSTIKGFYDERKTEKIFNLLKNPDTNLLLMPKFINELEILGLKEDDPRLSTMFTDIDIYKKEHGNSYYKGVDLEDFKKLTKTTEEVITRAFGNEFVISNWEEFKRKIHEIYETCQANEEGHVATYIPQLGSVDPSNWAVSVCSVDGQRFSFGNYQEYFTIQSVSKPFTYAIAVDNLGKDTVHQYVGKEPSGRMFNELILNHANKPHNPMINPGAIVVCSLINTLLKEFGEKPSLVFENTKHYFNKLAAGLNVGFNTPVYISEQEAADRNYAIAFYMKEHKCYPRNTNLGETLKLYFRCCALDVTTRILALMGATLANSGLNPLTSDRIFKTESVKHTLSLMYSCGLYDYSGEFAFEVGLPAKSGVSGALVISIPDVMGIGLWSPRLDRLGNSVRGIQFCEELVKKFPFHQYDNRKILLDHIHNSEKRKVVSDFEKSNIAAFEILSAAAKGKLHQLKRYFLNGANLEVADYDGRTALHLASVEGNFDCVEFLVSLAKVKTDVVDRWGQTPLMSAEQNGQKHVVNYLKNYNTVDSPPKTEQKLNESQEESDFNPLGMDKQFPLDKTDIIKKDPSKGPKPDK